MKDVWMISGFDLSAGTALPARTDIGGIFTGPRSRHMTIACHRKSKSSRPLSYPFCTGKEQGMRNVAVSEKSG